MISGHPFLFKGNFRPTYYSKTVISQAQIAALFSTPVTLVAGQAGWFYIPKAVHFQKDAGTAWTLNGSARLQVRVNVTTVAFATNAGFMDSVNQLTAFAQGSGDQISYFVGFAAPLVTGFNGASINITNDTANLSAGTGNLTVTTVYEQWPMIVAAS